MAPERIDPPIGRHASTQNPDAKLSIILKPRRQRRKTNGSKCQKTRADIPVQRAKLPDTNPEFTVAQVRDMYVNTYPELATAAIEGPTPVNGAMQYVFTCAVGAKG